MNDVNAWCLVVYLTMTLQVVNFPK